MDVNANEKSTAQSQNSSQQQSQQQQQQLHQTTTSGSTTNSNTTTNGQPPKGQRERSSRVAGVLRSKKPPSNVSDKHGNEKLVNGSS